MRPAIAQQNWWRWLLALFMGFAWVGVVFAASPNGVETPKKFALVLANSNYSSSSLVLKNPINDAKLVAQSLTRLGFEVRQAFDLNRAQMVATVSDFSAKLPAGATSLVFYAGHGMQIGGSSYLLPVDMVTTSEQSVPLRAFSLKTLLDKVSASSAAVNVVVLDACRDNPFQPPPAIRYRGVASLGLGAVVAPRGTLLAYSTAPGQLAADGATSNSLYSNALARTLLEPGLTLEDIFRKVGDQVRKKTLDDQIPWFESSLSAEYYLLPPKGVTVAVGKTLQPGTDRPQESSTRRNLKVTADPQKPVWYRSMDEYEWSALDFEIQQRVKHLTLDEIPAIEHRAKGGSVVAQTTLALFWLDGAYKATEVGSGKVTRYGANNTKGIRWLRVAAKAGFPIAQAELGERLYRGHALERNTTEGRQQLAAAALANYPRAKLDLMQINLESGKAAESDLTDAMDSVFKSIKQRNPAQ